MRFPLFSRVILTHDLPESNLVEGDVGVVVEFHKRTPERKAGYEIEFFAANGQTVAVASVPEDFLRAATSRDIFHVRVV